MQAYFKPEQAFSVSMPQPAFEISIACKNVTYFDSFGVEHIPKETKKFFGNKYIQANTFKIQAYDSVMRGYFCIGFIGFILKDKSLIDFTNLFSPKDFKRNDDII